MSSENTEQQIKNFHCDEEGPLLSEAENDDIVFRTPTPPKNTPKITSDIKYNVGDGKFEYITDIFNRNMIVNAWQAITETNLWDFVSKPIESFMWSNDQRIKIISEKMELLGYIGHSGATFGCTMRNMQYLAQNGEDNFKKLFV